LKNLYNKKFYESNRQTTLLGSKIILNLVFDKLKKQPENIIDIGCGTGEWLNSAFELGVKDLSGLDGPWVESESLINKKIKLKKLDLNKDFLQYKSKKFDFLICSEVLEHLDPNNNYNIIKKLCELSDVILFSAAIPGQRGTKHINCQWQSYWIKIFKLYNFKMHDIIRPSIWTNDYVEFWLKQNIFLFTSQNYKLNHDFELNNNYADIIHPDFLNIGVKRSLIYLANSIKNKFL
tara:strand:- start:1930 stop:2634 length:705 start_codon:yes stop_codon:yes gene_type:complete